MFTMFIFKLNNIHFKFVYPSISCFMFLVTQFELFFFFALLLVLIINYSKLCIFNFLNIINSYVYTFNNKLKVTRNNIYSKIRITILAT